MSKLPKISNWVISNKFIKALTEKVFGFVDLPLFSETTFAKVCKDNNFEILRAHKAEKSDYEDFYIPDNQDTEHVIQMVEQFLNYVRAYLISKSISL